MSFYLSCLSTYYVFLPITIYNVKVFCIHGSGVQTTKMLVYGEGEFPGSDPTMIKGDGDGTVNLQSLVGCTRWATQQREAVHHKEMPGVDHMGILRQLRPAKEIAAIIENLNDQLYEDVKYLNVEDY